MKRGDVVRLTYCGQTKPAKVLLVSPNGKSLMLAFEGVLYTLDGGAFFGSMPALRDARGRYRDLASDDLLAIEPLPAANQ